MQDKLDKWKLYGLRTWTIIGLCILFLAILKLCGIIWPAVATIVLTGLLVFLLHGMVNMMERHHIPRKIGAVICILVVIIIVLGAFALFVPALVTQISALVNAAPEYFDKIKGLVITYTNRPDSLITTSQAALVFDRAQSWLLESGAELAATLAGGLFGTVGSIGETFLVILLSLVAALWLLIDLPKVTEEFRNLFNESQRETLDIITSAFGNALYGWAKATIICAVITGVVMGIVFAILGVPFASLLGFAMGILYIIPYIGPVIGYVIGGVIALTVSPLICILSIVLNLVIHELIANLVSPRLMKTTVSVHPSLVLIAILAGEALAGVIGMLAAIPIVAAAQTIFVTYFEAHTGKTLYSEKGALFHKDRVAGAHDVKKSVSSASASITSKFKIPKK